MLSKLLSFKAATCVKKVKKHYYRLTKASNLHFFFP